MQTQRRKAGRPSDPVWGTRTVDGIVIGRDKIVVPPSEVEDLAALGCSDQDIANFYGVDTNTLRYNFTDYLVKGRENLKIALRRAMLKNACVNHSAAVQIFLAKNLLSMSDSGMVTDGSKVLPFTDDEDESFDVTDEDLAEQQAEYLKLDGAE